MKALKTAAVVGLVALTGLAHAAGVPGQGSWRLTLQQRDLDGNIDNGPEAFYDKELNITWLRAGSTTTMDWYTADAWAKQERFGLSGWRLPTTVDKGNDGCNWGTVGTDCGFNPDSSVATGSEMAHLFFQSLGNKSVYVPGTTNEQVRYGLTNAGEFQNLQHEFYWSGTEYALDSRRAWLFATSSGSQSDWVKVKSLFALAVRPGDVPAFAVPEPETYAMLLAGLGFVAVVARRRSKKQ